MGLNDGGERVIQKAQFVVGGCATILYAKYIAGALARCLSKLVFQYNCLAHAGITTDRAEKFSPVAFS